MANRLRFPPYMPMVGLVFSIITTVSIVAHFCSARPGGRAPVDPEFGSHWHDGRAEIDGYRFAVRRYGEERTGQAVMVFVTEPFRASTRVKADDPSRAPSDVFEALKLNLVRDFQTGIYDYNTMVSLFSRSDSFDPVKLTFSSAEWCGHVYEELLVEPQHLRHRVSSYFEGETTAGTLPHPPGGVIEEELFVRLRGLRGEYLRPGDRRTVPFMAGSFHRRLTHAPASWTRAEIERISELVNVQVPAGTFVTRLYVVRVTGGREGRFHIEAAYPHRIVKWAWSAARGTTAEASESGELTGTQRVAYWKLNGQDGERWLKPLGLLPSPRTTGR